MEVRSILHVSDRGVELGAYCMYCMGMEGVSS